MLKMNVPKGFTVRSDGDPVKDAPAGLTEARVNEIVNGALNRFAKQDFPKLIEGFGGQLTQVADNLTKLQEGLTALQGQGGGGDDKKGKGKDDAAPSPELNARLQQLERANQDAAKKLEAMEKARKDAEERALSTDKESRIRTALSQFSFVSQEAAEDAFSIVSGLVRRDESGNLVAGDESSPLPFDAFIKDFVPTKKGHFLAPAGKAGSGAGAGVGRTGAAGTFTLEGIKPGMSKEDVVKAASDIRRALNG